MRKSVTLVELIISMVLFGVIVLGAVSLHLSGEKFLSSSENKTYVLNELTFVLQHLHKNILQAEGNIDNVGITITSVASRITLQLRQISRTVQYVFDNNGGNHRIRFRVVGDSWEILTDRFMNPPVAGFPLSVVLNADGGVAITNLALRLDPTSAEDSRDNPQVSTRDTAAKRTVYFYSINHSWN
ncbi:MAG: hypothetical protein KAS05_02265 [Candidatus Omnitrophica bacterium]|nr:hypothetical protein [Candidatus Omnitrophota bacterium]